ncbi:HlyD family efflux transporter periplasmic adaptor subunit [Piscinibacter sp. XHJ-5]|uniref:HlyD family efflux transporter periplasmic adaptor subunit n=1 Tax=Piscinibacter sp. XHJ-5 TaxID=3037797 RepID=UPI00245348F5|nr:HlyD family efflux transporter periplasmic adaptor subunit [Piscinibacter sp. XHJ-5]
MSHSEDNKTPVAPAPAVSASKRKPALLAVAGLTLLAGIAYGGYWALFLRHYESTDNAYVQAPVVQVTPQVGGTVLQILADDTDVVRAGQPLVKLDPSDARLALERAEAQLAQTVREVRSLYATNGTLSANIHLREAEVARMRADVARTSEDVGRRQPLAATGAVSGEEMKHAETALAAARSALAGAQSALAAAREQAATNQVLTEGTSIENHPNVQRAAAAVREAHLALQRMDLPAPVAGQVAKRTVQVGQRIQAGAPLMSVIPLDQVWVEANFKEVQLRKMRIGQPVTLHADIYGEKVEYQGHVAGLGAGTGAAFALLPAQNATGNWIKVVQRVPVRVELDARQIAAHPLRVGLSMEATVDVAEQGGQPLTAASAARATRTQAFDTQPAEADRVVHDIIAANLGRPLARVAATTH